MTITATTDSRFLRKYLLIGLVCTGFGLWAVYDGFVNYPSKIPIAAAWEELVADETLDDAAKDAQYKVLAEDKGWPSRHPGGDATLEAIHHSILWQYAFIALGLGIGIPCLVMVLRNRGTWVAATNEGITSSWGQAISFDQIRKFDKKKWEKKGIGVLTYDSPAGQKKFIVDDLKYSRREMDEIVRLIESKIPAAMVVNGPLEKRAGDVDDKITE